MIRYKLILFFCCTVFTACKTKYATKEFKVYQQEGLRCKTKGCRDTIKKIIVSNRSTFFCNSCQNQINIQLTALSSQAIPLRMANTKSAIKRIRRISKQTAVNKARKSRFRNALKKMNALIG